MRKLASLVLTSVLAAVVACMTVPAMAGEVIVLKDSFVTSGASNDIDFERSSGRQSGSYYDANGAWGYVEWQNSDFSSLSSTGLAEVPGVATYACAFGNADTLPLSGDVFDVSVKMKVGADYLATGYLFLTRIAALYPGDGCFAFGIKPLGGVYILGANWGQEGEEWIVNSMTSQPSGEYTIRLHVDNRGSKAAIQVFINEELIVVTSSQAKYTAAYAGVGLYANDALASIEFKDLTVSYQDAPPVIPLNANVTLENYSGSLALCPVWISVHQGDVLIDFKTVTPSSTTFTIPFSNLNPGNYTVSASAAKWLTKRVDINVVAGSTSDAVLSLPNGDIDGTGEIDWDDYNIVVNNFGALGD